MSSVVCPEYTRYLEEVSSRPLSETITEAESLFGGDMSLFFKSDEEVVEVGSNAGFGRVLGYVGNPGEELFVYLGLVYSPGGGKMYPSCFLFGTDLEKDKLVPFLDKIQRERHYYNRKNVIEPRESSGSERGALLLSCVESHKARKKSLYEGICAIAFGSPIQDLKSLLDYKLPRKP